MKASIISASRIVALALFISGVFSACLDVTAKPPKSDRIRTPNGVAVGDVRFDSAVIWSRADRDAEMKITIHGKHQDHFEHQIDVERSNHYTGQIMLKGLQAETSYQYTVTFRAKQEPNNTQSENLSGSFKTTPDNLAERPVRFAWGGDLGGQNVCRDTDRGFPVFDVMNQTRWDFFIGLGDMIYADGNCDKVGRYGNNQITGDFIQSANLESYWAHWSYNRQDQGLQKILAHTPYIAVWDDHEVVGDFGPLHDTRDSAPYTRGGHLLPIGLKAFLDYNPVAGSPQTPKRLYRTIRWGRHVELFILDTRQYRDANFRADDSNAPKSMLGREQLTWLKEKLAASDATWKVIVSSVPMSIPTGSPPFAGRDGWANFNQNGGFEHELLDILRFMQQQGIQNKLWLTTDVHFSAGFRYQPFVDAPEFEVYEFISGPLNSGIFPNPNFDTSLNPKRLFFYDAPAGLNFDGALEYFTFGAVEVSDAGDLNIKIINAKGMTVAEQFLPPNFP